MLTLIYSLSYNRSRSVILVHYMYLNSQTQTRTFKLQRGNSIKAKMCMFQKILVLTLQISQQGMIHYFIEDFPITRLQAYRFLCEKEEAMVSVIQKGMNE